MSWTSLLYLAASRTDVRGWKWTELPPAWILTLVAVALFLGLRALYRTERGRADLPARLFLAAVRTVVLLLLLLVLAGPYREEVTVAEERSHLVILVDDSGSMNTTDVYEASELGRLRDGLGERNRATGRDPANAKRLDLVRWSLAEPGEELLRRLDEKFVLHAYAFDVDWRGLGSTRDAPPGGEAEEEGPEPILRIAEEIRGLEGEGSGTDLGSALRGVAAEFLGREDRRLAGVLLLSDGRETSVGEEELDVFTGLGPARRDLKVTAVALGNPSSGRNVRVERIRAMDVVLIEDDVLFETAVRQQGFDGLEDVEARLRIEKVADENRQTLPEPVPYTPPPGSLVRTEPFRLLEEAEPTPVHLRARMSQAGTYRVTIEAVLPPDAEKEDAIRDDNEAVHWLRVVDQRIKVLYVDNLPRYELRFLGNWLTREPDSDPSRPERRRRYEAQVLQQSADPSVDQSSSRGVPPLRRFPSERRELFDYDVIIFGDVDRLALGESAQESRRILELIREFVREGGGIALQAGANYNNPLEFRDTPLQDLLPITTRKKRDQNVSNLTSKAFRVELTDAGRLYPGFAVASGPEGDVSDPDHIAKLWRGDLAASQDWRWYWMYRATGGLRPGAVDLARAAPEDPHDSTFLDESRRPVVVFAHMPYGKGRVFWSALDSLWRIRRGHSDRYYGRFWDQVIRHLATYRLLGGNRRFKISTDKDTYFQFETATITITALDHNYEPMDDDTLSGVHVESPDGDDFLLEGDQEPRNMRADGAAPGTYRMYMPLRKKGTYRVWITDAGRGRSRATESRAERRIEVEWRTPELRQTIPDHELLRSVVDETGGQLVDGRLARVYDLPGLVDQLESQKTERVINRRERTQWDKPWVLLLLVGLLALEWILRKRWQMI